MALLRYLFIFFFFQAEDGIRDIGVTGVQTCALPIWRGPGIRASSGSLSHVVALTQRYRGLGEGLFVEHRLYPEEPFFGPEARKIEGRHDGRRSLFATQPDRVLLRLLEHFAVLVGDQDPGSSLPVGRVLAPLELGVDDEGEPFVVLAGSELVEYPEEGKPAIELAATLRQNESRALDYAFAGPVVTQVPPRRSGYQARRRAPPAKALRRPSPRPRPEKRRAWRWRSPSRPT